MPSSALSGNIQGLASASSPGIVGTGAQTFGGKKTLDGGALIKGDTSGVAIAAGYVGQQQRVAFSNVVATTGSSNIASISLSAGIYYLRFDGNGVVGSSTGMSVSIGTSPTGVTGQAGDLSNVAIKSADGVGYFFHLQLYVNISAPTTYYANAQTGSASSGGLYGVFESVRIG